MSTDIEAIIAKAIRTADSSYFFEDYTKQARAVIDALRTKKLAIVPAEPTEAMVQAGVEALPSGRVKPEAIAASVYTAMAATTKKTGTR